MMPYIHVRDNMLPTKFCEKLITKFEENEGRFQKLTTGNSAVKRSFVEINISQHWQDEHDLFVTCVQEAWKVYLAHEKVLFDVQWPRQFGYEQFRMKRYEPNGIDEFGHHTDVSNYSGSRRFLSFLWYLNTVEEGGQTGFGLNVGSPDLMVDAIRGRLLMFPPLWTHPHWGAKVLKGNKYIVSGYLHYI